MEDERKKELIENTARLQREKDLRSCSLFIFGHSNASEELIDVLAEVGVEPVAILDNNKKKHGKKYKDIRIVPPEEVLLSEKETVVCIVSRFYEEMYAQLRYLGFDGQIVKLIDYNTFAEYSLSEDTIRRKKERAERGAAYLGELKSRYPDHFKVFCPFQALGDVYFTMMYLPAFLKRQGFEKSVVCVVGNACGKVASLFSESKVEVLDQTRMDETVQGVIYTCDQTSFIAHQDRPYVVKLHRALYLKCIPLETIYCCGIFGLPQGTEAIEPTNWRDYPDLSTIEEEKAVILSPFAKSVTMLPNELWSRIVDECRSRGYQVFTNISGDEKPLPGTLELRAELCEMRSVVEKAGLFIGIRSGLCDIIRTAKAKKIALFPDYYYGDTRWKSIDMYSIDGFENIQVTDDYDKVMSMIFD